MSDDMHAVVFDNGTATVKAGFAGEEGPSLIVPTNGTCEADDRSEPGAMSNGAAAKDEGERSTPVASLRTTSTSPIERGVILQWDAMERLWSHLLSNKLRVSAEEHPIFHAEPALSPKVSREKLVQMMFEGFGCPATYIAIQPVLTLYASGRTTGLVVEIGDGVSQTVPIVEGYALLYAASRRFFAGRDLTTHLQRLLGNSLHVPCGEEQHDGGVPAPLAYDIVSDIKHKMCYIAPNYEEELTKAEDPETLFETKEYELPDGTTVSLGKERFQCPEALFQPELYPSHDMRGLHSTVFESIMMCDVEVCKDLYGNIVMSGGSTLFDGMQDRLTRELTGLAPLTLPVKATTPSDRLTSVWVGGSILSSLSTFQTMWITREEFDESGPVIVHRKCMN